MYWLHSMPLKIVLMFYRSLGKTINTNIHCDGGCRIRPNRCMPWTSGECCERARYARAGRYCGKQCLISHKNMTYFELKLNLSCYKRLCSNVYIFMLILNVHSLLSFSFVSYCFFVFLSTKTYIITVSRLYRQWIVYSHPHSKQY